MKIKKILIVVVIILVGAGIGVGSMILKDKLFPIDEAQAAANEKKVKMDEVGPLLELGEFIINLKGGGILKTEITVEGMNEKSLEKLQAKQVFLRDKVITVFAAKELEDIIAVEERDNLKKELVIQLKQISNDEVKDVLFKSYVYSF